MMRRRWCIIHTSTASRSMLIHAANAITTLDQAGQTIDQLAEFWGSLLVIEIAGNGDRWYNRQQIEAFLAD